MKTRYFIPAIVLASGLAGGCTTEYDIAGSQKITYIDHLAFRTEQTRYKESPSDEEWTSAESRTINPYCRLETPVVNAWGGRTDMQATAIEGTDGFFRLGRVGQRWVFVDPDGGVNIIRGTQNLAFPESSRFSSADDWAAETGSLLLKYGFNMGDFAGVRPNYQLAAINEQVINPAEGKKCAYTIGLNMLRSFMWDDAKNLPWAYDDTNNSMNRLNLIFEPRYETYLDQKVAEICAQCVDDPYMVGYQLDNELGFKGYDYRYGDQDILIHKFLILPEESAARQYAEAYVTEKGLNRAEVLTVTKTKDVVNLGLTDAYNEFRSRVAEKYYQQYRDVIRKYDTHHLIFGSRLHSNGKYDQWTLQACAKYCDVVTINYYGAWTPETDFLENFRTWTGDRPFFVTEFYVKGADANYDGTRYNNLTGGGWLVESQIERSYFYQNFCLGLLEAKNCVGWTHFAYDDAFTSTTANNGNRGLVSAKYYPYLGFLDGVGRINNNVYAIMDYFDK